jgi:cell division protein FtsB
MAKALFGFVVAPHELRAAEENAALRARVRRLEAQVAVLQEERDATIARELLGMAEEPVAASEFASTSA